MAYFRKRIIVDTMELGLATGGGCGKEEEDDVLITWSSKK
jgi:hypothetical protein